MNHLKFFDHYINHNFHLMNAIDSYKSEVPEFSLKKYRELLKKSQFRERYEEVKQLELDTIKESLRKLAMGIPIKDNSGNILGWQEKPDIKAIEEYQFNLEKSKL